MVDLQIFTCWKSFSLGKKKKKKMLWEKEMLWERKLSRKKARQGREGEVEEGHKSRILLNQLLYHPDFTNIVAISLKKSRLHADHCVYPLQRLTLPTICWIQLGSFDNKLSEGRAWLIWIWPISVISGIGTKGHLRMKIHWRSLIPPLCLFRNVFLL